MIIKSLTYDRLQPLNLAMRNNFVENLFRFPKFVPGIPWIKQGISLVKLEQTNQYHFYMNSHAGNLFPCEHAEPWKKNHTHFIFAVSLTGNVDLLFRCFELKNDEMNLISQVSLKVSC